jgi:hypothetical protein
MTIYHGMNISTARKTGKTEGAEHLSRGARIFTLNTSDINNVSISSESLDELGNLDPDF